MRSRLSVKEMLPLIRVSTTVSVMMKNLFASTAQSYLSFSAKGIKPSLFQAQR